MKKFVKFPFLIALILTALIACDKDDDTEDTVDPTIKSAMIDNSDEDILVTAGNEIHFDVEVEDNEALGELKIDVHDIFDGHSHGKKSATKWADVKTIQLSGKTQDVHEHMDVPTNATAGPYHAIFRLIDAEGNEGEFVELDFMVSNGSEPMINVTDPDFSSEVHVNKGGSISLKGTITDDTDLDEIVIVLEEEHDDHSHGKKSDTPLFEADFDLDGSSDLSWDFETDGNVTISIPANAEEGHYALEIIATDNDGNISIFEGEVHIM